RPVCSRAGRAGLGVLGEHLGGGGPVAPGPGDDVATGRRVLAEHATVVGGCLHQRASLLRGPLGGGERGGGRGAPRGVVGGGGGLDVGAVAADADDDAVTDVDRRHGSRVDVAEVLHQVAQAVRAAGLGTEVEPLEPDHPVLVAACDAVQVLLHGGGGVVVGQPDRKSDL